MSKPVTNPSRKWLRDYQRAWISKRRLEYFEGKYCERCGSSEDLQLDHVDPDKKISHRIWSWSEERREEEIAKCQVLCKPCHRSKTFDQRPKGSNTANSRLTEEQVVEIRELYQSGSWTYQRLADRYHVGKRTVADVIKRVTWSHI